MGLHQGQSHAPGPCHAAELGTHLIKRLRVGLGRQQSLHNLDVPVDTGGEQRRPAVLLMRREARAADPWAPMEASSAQVVQGSSARKRERAHHRETAHTMLQRTLSGVSLLAPAANSAWTTSVCPLLLATHSGV